jgi:leucyl aminopeptidase
MFPTSTAVDIVSRSAVPANAQAVVVFVAEGADAAGKAGAALGKAERTALELLISAKAVKGRAKEVVIDVIETGGGKFRRLVVAGLGKPDKIAAESFRQAGGAVVRALRRNKVTSAAFIIDGKRSISAADAAGAVVSGALLAAFDFDQYRGAGRKKDDSEQDKRLDLTVVTSGEDAAQVRQAIERGRIIADGQNFARTTASRPGNDINPPTLAKVAQAMANEVGIDCRVLDEKQMQKLGMGGILAVGGGSIGTPPRMIVMEYKGSGFKAAGSGKQKTAANRKSQIANASAPLLVVGKAITFDSGGISIKPADKMGRMIFDKCGAMAVLGLMYAVAKLRLPVHVVGILSSAENVISSQAYRPGDIIRL